MRQDPCPQERAVLQAVRRRALTGDLRAHAETCTACRETARLADALTELAAASRPVRPLPSAGQIWWRAEIVRRLVGSRDERQIRELRPAVWGEWAGLFVALAVFVVWVSLEVPSLLGL